MVLYTAGKGITLAHATRARSAPPRCAHGHASIQPLFLTNGVTFLKTLVSDYQILSPVPSFACTLVQQSSQYKSMTLSGRLLCGFCLIRAYRQQMSTYFDLSPV